MLKDIAERSAEILTEPRYQKSGHMTIAFWCYCRVSWWRYRSPMSGRDARTARPNDEEISGENIDSA